MTMGPAPMIRMVWMSVRLGMAVLGCGDGPPQGFEGMERGVGAAAPGRGAPGRGF
jgi:hypothetical protein